FQLILHGGVSLSYRKLTSFGNLINRARARRPANSPCERYAADLNLGKSALATRREQAISPPARTPKSTAPTPNPRATANSVQTRSSPSGSPPRSRPLGLPRTKHPGCGQTNSGPLPATPTAPAWL